VLTGDKQGKSAYYMPIGSWAFHQRFVDIFDTIWCYYINSI